MDFFKDMIIKDGKPNYRVIAVKAAFLLMAIIYMILFFKFKSIALGSFLYPVKQFGFFYFLMFLPVIACLAFVVLAHSTDWMHVFWQMAAVTVAFLVLTLCVSLFDGLKSETTDTKNYLVFDSYLSENDAVDPGNSKEKATQTFEQEVKTLMPVDLESVKSADYFYDYTSLPILDGYFDVSLKAKYKEDNFVDEINRLQKQFPKATALPDGKDEDITHYVIRGNDNPSSYFYTFYSVNEDKRTIYYYSCFSERSSTTPAFEKDGFDLGRIGKGEEDEESEESSEEEAAEEK